MCITNKEITFDDILTITIVVLLIMMTRSHQAIFFYCALGCCLLRITKPVVILPGYFLSSLSTAYFEVSEGMGAGRYMSLLLILSFVISSIRRGDKLDSDKYFSIIMLLIISCFLSSFIGPTSNFTTAIQMTMNLAILLFIQRIEMGNMSRLIAHLVIASSLLVLSVFMEAMTNSVFLLEQRYRAVGVNDDEGTNANRMAIMLEQCGTICVACFFYYKNYLIKMFLLGCVVASAFIIIATGSRTGLIALLTAIAFSLIVIGGVNKVKLIIPFICLLMVSFLLVDYLSTINSPVLERFTYSNVENTGGAGRIDGAYIIMTRFFPDHMLFGSGIGGANMLYFSSQYRFPNLCHNIVFDPLSQLGIIIYGLFLSFLVPAFKRIARFVKSYPNQSVCVALLVAICLNGIGETIFYEKYFWNNLALCLLCCKQYNVS